jgi:hypothetical protein
MVKPYDIVHYRLTADDARQLNLGLPNLTQLNMYSPGEVIPLVVGTADTILAPCRVCADPSCPMGRRSTGVSGSLKITGVCFRVAFAIEGDGQGQWFGPVARAGEPVTGTSSQTFGTGAGPACGLCGEPLPTHTLKELRFCVDGVRRRMSESVQALVEATERAQHEAQLSRRRWVGK